MASAMSLSGDATVNGSGESEEGALGIDNPKKTAHGIKDGKSTVDDSEDLQLAEGSCVKIKSDEPGQGFLRRLGVIGGSGTMKCSTVADIVERGKRCQVHTQYGSVVVTIGPLTDGIELCLVQRHVCDLDGQYRPPHSVNYQAIVSALKELCVDCVIGVASVGSLKKCIRIGQVIVPDDFFCLHPIISLSPGKEAHCVPGMSEALRGELLQALVTANIPDVVYSGVYYNANGPRFETKAEIRFMSHFADIVGMTAAHEVTLTREAGIPYAILAVVDNMANGLETHDQVKLSLDSFIAQQDANKGKVDIALQAVLAHFSSQPDSLSRISGKLTVVTEQCGKIDEKLVVDQIIHASTVVTVDQSDRVLNDHALVIKDGVIKDLLPSSKADLEYGPVAKHILRLPDTVLLPGLINAHTHASMVFMRGLGDDMNLVEWLSTKIWPAEGRCVSEEFVRDGTRLACTEFIRGGTTCFNDMYFFPESAADVIKECGLRATVGAPVLEFPTNYASCAAECLEKGEKLLQKINYDGKDSAVRSAVSPHSPYTVSNESLIAAHALAKKYDVPLHIHVHESVEEMEASEKGDHSSGFCHTCKTAGRPLKYLVDIGLVDERFVAAHMCHVTDEEAKLLALAGASVVHCPTSNLKLASGFCPLEKLLKAGVNVALGTDGAASNNSLDMFAEMKLAAVMAKGVSGDPKAVSARQALRISTINGAKALGIDHLVGSLEIGKRADLVAVDMSEVSILPIHDIESHLVYSTNSRQVSHVWVDGKCLLKDGKFANMDIEKIRSSTQRWKAAINSVK